MATRSKTSQKIDPVKEEKWVPFHGVFGDTGELRVLLVASSLPDDLFTKAELAASASIAKNTLDKVLPKFLKYGIIREGRKVGHVQLYQLDKACPLVPAVAEFNQQVTSILARPPPEFEAVTSGQIGAPTAAHAPH